jgi:hypothetical protein
MAIENSVRKAAIRIAGLGTRHFCGARQQSGRVLDCGGKRSATPLSRAQGFARQNHFLPLESNGVKWQG